MPTSFNQLDKYIQKLLTIQEERKDALFTAQSLKEIAEEMGFTEADWNAAQKACDQHLERAKGFSKYENWEKAIEEYEQVKAIRPNSFTALYGLAHAHTQQWKAKGEEEDKEAAKKYAAQCLELDPKHDPSFVLLSQLDKKTGIDPLRLRNLIIAGLLIVIGGLIFAPFLKPAEQENENLNKPPSSETLLQTSTASLDEGQVTVDFLQDDLAQNLTFELADLGFSHYKEQYNFNVSGYLKPEGIEIYDLRLNFVLYNEKGKIIDEISKHILQKRISPTARSADQIPFGLVEYNPFKAKPSLARVLVSVKSMDKAPAAKTYESGDTVLLEWSPKRPSNVDVVVLARKNKQDFSAYSDRLQQDNTFEIQNIGNSPLRSMEGHLAWVKKDGSVISSRDNYLLLNFHPNLKPEQTRISNFSAYTELPKDSLAYYKLVITSVDF